MPGISADTPDRKRLYPQLGSAIVETGDNQRHHSSQRPISLTRLMVSKTFFITRQLPVVFVLHGLQVNFHSGNIGLQIFQHFGVALPFET